MPDSKQELSKTWARIVTKAWADQDYKRRLLADPAAVAREEGVPVPAGLTLKVVEDAPGTRTLVLPPIPPEVGTAVEADERRAASGLPGGDCVGCCSNSCLSEGLPLCLLD